MPGDKEHNVPARRSGGQRPDRRRRRKTAARDPDRGRCSAGAVRAALRPAARPGPAPDPAEFRRQLREHLAAELNRPSAGDCSRTNFCALSEKIVEQAVKGKKDFVQIVLDRMGGRPPAAAASDEEHPGGVEYVIGVPRPEYDEPENPAAAELPAVPAAG